MISLVLFLILITCIYLFLEHKFNFWLRHGIPHLKPHSWLVGNLRGVGSRNVAEYLGCVYHEMQKFGLDKISGFYFFTEPALLATDPEHIRLVLSRDFEYFHDRGVFVNEKDDPLSAHLFSLEGAKWKRLRKKFSPTFTSGKMKNMFEIVLKVAKELNCVLNDELQVYGKKEMEIRDICSRFTIDIIGSCAFGIECERSNLLFFSLNLIKFNFKVTAFVIHLPNSKKLGCNVSEIQHEKCSNSHLCLHSKTFHVKLGVDSQHFERKSSFSI